MKTEEEAKDTICCGPMGLIQAIVIHAAARSNVDLKVSHCCAASECMAWRWLDNLTDDGTACNWMPSAQFARLPKDTEPKPLDQRRGYCGLTAKP